jgi:hypothetical protein
MTQTRERPPPAGGGPVELSLSFPGGNDLQAISPNQGPAQAEIRRDPRGGRAPLHLVRPAPLQRRRLAVRISAADGRAPYGRSRALRLTHDDLDELIDFGLRLEAQR